MKVIQIGTGKVLWEGAGLFRAGLSRADLSGADLSRANLSGADLSGANLSGAYRPEGTVDGGWTTDPCGYLKRAT